MNNVKFYVCSVCGNVVEKVVDKGVPVMCCGKKMEELIPNTVEASGEKHKPVVKVENGKVIVNVGSVNHPMLDEHRIDWILLCTENGRYRKELKPGQAPEAEFIIGDEKPVAAYAYCNLHGLWMTEI